MRKVLVTTLLVAATVGSQAQVKKQSHGYPIDPVPFTSVKVTDSFWGQRLNASRGNHPPGIQQMRGNRKISELRQRSPPQ